MKAWSRELEEEVGRIVRCRPRHELAQLFREAYLGRPLTADEQQTLAMATTFSLEGHDASDKDH